MDSSELTQLRVLDLEGQCMILPKFNGLSNLLNLRDLTLAFECISFAKEICYLPKLKRLHLLGCTRRPSKKGNKLLPLSVIRNLGGTLDELYIDLRIVDIHESTAEALGQLVRLKVLDLGMVTKCDDDNEDDSNNNRQTIEPIA